MGITTALDQQNDIL